jgi:hypothetical protein
MFRFSIRDLLWVTVVVAVAVGWFLERKALLTCANESASWQALSESLTKQLEIKHPAASIEIMVNGRSVTTSTGYAAPSPHTLTKWR